MDTAISCSMNMPWDLLAMYLISHSHKIMPIRGDGFCFLNATDLILYHDYNKVVTVYCMASNILGHLAAHVDYYKQFHTVGILQDAEGYFIFGNFCDSIINVFSFVTAKALHINLLIYQKEPDGNIQVIGQTTDIRGRECHLKVYVRSI